MSPDDDLHLLPKNTDILFESRERARWRKITNEDHLLNKLNNELSFKTEKFFPETLSFREQLEKIQSSKCFIGTGASLPISFFMSKELLPCKLSNIEYVGLLSVNVPPLDFDFPKYGTILLC